MLLVDKLAIILLEMAAIHCSYTFVRKRWKFCVSAPFNWRKHVVNTQLSAKSTASTRLSGKLYFQQGIVILRHHYRVVNSWITWDNTHLYGICADLLDCVHLFTNIWDSWEFSVLRPISSCLQELIVGIFAKKMHRDQLHTIVTKSNLLDQNHLPHVRVQIINHHNLRE